MKWKERNIWEKIYFVLMMPFDVVRDFTIPPTCQMDYHKWIVVL